MEQKQENDYKLPRPTPAVKREWLKQDKIIYGALAGTALILLQPFLNKGQFEDTPAKVTVIAFAIAIPLLAALILVNEEENFRNHATPSKLVAFTRVIGQCGAFVGIAAAFWHINKIAGICVIGASIFAMAAHSAGFYTLAKSAKKNR